MKARLEEKVFSIGGRTYDWSDVILAAALRGEWTGLVEEARLGLACARRADDLEVDADRDTVEAEANEFRYARDLLTAEETEAWLAGWGLTVDEWMECLRRAVLRREWCDDAGGAPVDDLRSAREAEDDDAGAPVPDADGGDEADDLEEAPGDPDAVLADYPVPDAEVAEVVWAEAGISGRLARYASDLAGRAAVADSAPDGNGRTPSAPADAVPVGVPAAAEPDLPGLPRASPERLAALARLEEVFGHAAAAAVTAEAVRAEVGLHRLDWIRLVCRYLVLPAEDAAREALLSVRDDGLALEAVAEAAGTSVHEAHLYLDRVPPALRDAALAARTGEVLGPVRLDDGFGVFLVLDKRLASADDPETRRRAEEALWTRAVERAVQERVRWHRRL